MMPNCCTVCLNNGRKSKGMSFFAYPKDLVRRHSWLIAVGRDDLINRNGDYRICEQHFESKFISYSKYRTKKYLSDDAFPSLNFPSYVGASTSAAQSQSLTYGSSSNEGLSTTTAAVQKNALGNNNCITIPIENIKMEQYEDDVRRSPDAGRDSPGEDAEPQAAGQQSTSMILVKKEENCDEEMLKQTIRNIEAQLHDLVHGQDSFDSFGKYVASVMRSMPLQRAMELQPRIVNLLVQGATGGDDNQERQF